MKINLILLALITTLAAGSASGQGYFKFSSTKSAVWDGSGAGAILSTRVEVALLWAIANTPSPFAGGAIGLNAVPISYGSSTVVSWAAPQAANALAASSFTFATSATTPSPGGTPIIGFTSSTGAVSFNSGARFDTVGGPGPAQTYTLMLVSWDRAYPSFSAAATAITAQGTAAMIGWSAPVQVQSGSALNDPNISSINFLQFGTFVVVDPEPGTLALTALGGVSLLIFRRRK